MMLPIILAIRDENDRNYAENEYYKYRDKLYKLAYRYLKDDDASKECVQEVVVALVEYLEKYKEWDITHQKNFLAKCCRSVAQNKYNRRLMQRKHEVSFYHKDEDGEIQELDLPDNEPSMLDIIISEENQRRLSEMLENIDPKYGDILYFKCFVGMKNKDIAEMLGMDVNLVNVRIMRARKILLEKYGEELYDIRTKR